MTHSNLFELLTDKKLTYDLVQSVVNDRYILESTSLPDEEEGGITCRHAPQFLMNFGPMAEEIVYAPFSYNLRKESGIQIHIKEIKYITELKHNMRFRFLGSTYPGRKVLFGFKIRLMLCIVVHWVIAEVSLHGVTRQLEVHLLLLSTLGAKYSLS